MRLAPLFDLALAPAVGLAGLFLAPTRSGGAGGLTDLAISAAASSYDFTIIERHFDRTDARH